MSCGTFLRVKTVLLLKIWREKGRGKIQGQRAWSTRAAYWPQRTAMGAPTNAAKEEMIARENAALRKKVRFLTTTHTHTYIHTSTHLVCTLVSVLNEQHRSAEGVRARHHWRHSAWRSSSLVATLPVRSTTRLNNLSFARGPAVNRNSNTLVVCVRARTQACMFRRLHFHEGDTTHLHSLRGCSSPILPLPHTPPM
jgi:hypothetical protein